jgi:NADH dehydrogenase
MVLLTGATGFVGPHLVKALRARGEPIRCLVRDLERGRRLAESGVESIKGDLCDPASLERAIDGAKPKYIIHMAKLHEGSAQAIQRVNVDGTRTLIEIARKAGVQRFVHISALGAAPKPQFPYAYSEWQAEELVRRSELGYLILRPAIICGPGDPFTSGLIRLVKSWPICLVPGSGQTKYQPLWIEDFVRLVIAALDGTLPAERTIPVGGGEILTLEAMLLQIMGMLGRSRPVIHLPRRSMRAVVRTLRRIGLSTPWVPGHFLSRDNVAGLDAIPRAFGFQPRGWSEQLPQSLACPSEQNLLA